MTLRWYQQEAFDAAVAWMRRCVDPALIELPTGSGKSHVVSAIAEWSHHESGKKVLCLAPSKELTEQNFEKYQLTGNPASYYSASLGRSMAHPVVYGTPQTVINDIKYFRDQFGVVICDESHETTPTIRKIISSIREHNPRLRVIGLTATPYTMQQGYIYTHDEDGNPTQSEDAYYKRLIYRLTARTLIDEGFLTPPNLDPTTESYDTSALEVARTGLFTSASIERAFEGKGRLTADIVADVVRHAQDRMGVMIFAATVQHAKEIMESLPPDLSRMIGGDVNMGKAERETLVRDFKAQRFKYLVSVGTLTRGFDATHVDVVAILRATESPGLLQQIIGRGLRLHEGKTDCIAEGQKVLTDQGLVNIEDVRLCHKLWDGVEWVSHDGVIYKGEREVITHDGLTATEDHMCWTEAGWKTLGLLQQTGETLTKTGNGGQAIKLIDNSGREDHKDRRSTKSLYADSVHELRGGEREVFIESSQRNGGVPKVRKEEALRKAMPWRSPMASSKMHICKTEVHERKRPELPELWRKGDNIRLQDPIRNGPMDYGQHPQLVEGFTNRQDRQQQGLCPWEYQDGSTKNKHEQPEDKLCNTNGTCVHDGASSCELRSEHAYSKDMGRNEFRGNTKTVGGAVVKTKRRVWDIVNAGPRNRFTCQGRLVSNCLVLDYAGNIERHGLHDDLFTPEVRTPKRSENGEPLAVACPQCGTVNQFTARPNPDGFALGGDGYFRDLDGNYIETTSGAIPSHYGRRCFGQVIIGGHVERCNYRWSSKECPSCAHHNDIAARYCEKCNEEIIDPNEKLQLEFQRMKSDPQSLTTDAVRSWKVQQWTSNAGNVTVRIDYVTDYARFPIWYSPRINKSLWADLCSAVFGKMCPSVELFVEHHQKGRMPTTITAVKPKGSRYYRAYAHNRPEDVAPL